MPQGFFITFEGLDGSGKSTQLRKLADWLRARGEQVVTTRQPGGTPFGDRIRTLLLDSRGAALAAHAELGLMFSDRAQCIAEVIQPAIDQDSVVVCDRFTDSTEAYQGAGRNLGGENVLTLHRILCGALAPDLTLLLLPDFVLSLARARRRNARVAAATGEDENRFETLDTDFFRRVYLQYRHIAQREPVRVIAIESDADVDEIHRRIVSVVEERLRSHRRARSSA
ncbi:MAG: dTMP kinase [Acidobacteriaceae bacterium]